MILCFWHCHPINISPSTAVHMWDIAYIHVYLANHTTQHIYISLQCPMVMYAA